MSFIPLILNDTITITYFNFTPPVSSLSLSGFSDGQWSVGLVLHSYSIPLLYELILKGRRKELIGRNEYMTDKVKELQVINESLLYDLQVARINNQSLQEKLLALESGIHFHVPLYYNYCIYTIRLCCCVKIALCHEIIIIV